MPTARNGHEKQSVIETLLRTPQKFSFNMAMRLLRSHFGQNVDINVHPSLNLSFNDRDVVAIKIYDRDLMKGIVDFNMRWYAELTIERLLERFRSGDSLNVTFDVSVNFLGLYGSSSPLPIYYTEGIMEDANQDNNGTREFVDVINRPIYRQFEMAQNKYQLFSRCVDVRDESLIERMFAFAGLSIAGIREPCGNDVYHLLPYLGIYSMMPRSIAGLRAIFEREFGDEDVEIFEYAHSVCDIPEEQMMSLGKENSTLGNTCYLGTTIGCRDGAILINISCDDMHEYESMLPGGEKLKKLSWLMTHYLVDRVDIKLSICCKNPGNTDYAMDDEQNPLGVNSYLGGAFDENGQLQGLRYECLLDY